MDQNNQDLGDKVVKDIQKDFKVVGKGRIRSLHVWIGLALILGLGLGIGYVADQSGNFQSGSAASGSQQYAISKDGLTTVFKGLVPSGSILYLGEVSNKVVDGERKSSWFVFPANSVTITEATAFLDNGETESFQASALAQRSQKRKKGGRLNRASTTPPIPNTSSTASTTPPSPEPKAPPAPKVVKNTYIITAPPALRELVRANGEYHTNYPAVKDSDFTSILVTPEQKVYFGEKTGKASAVVDVTKPHNDDASEINEYRITAQYRSSTGKKNRDLTVEGTLFSALHTGTSIRVGGPGAPRILVETSLGSQIAVADPVFNAPAIPLFGSILFEGLPNGKVFRDRLNFDGEEVDGNYHFIITEKLKSNGKPSGGFEIRKREFQPK